MLIPLLLASLAEEPAWTGEVRAFAVYANLDCLPNERMATVYVGRKVYGTGKSVTAVRTVPANTPIGSATITEGEGRIERDEHGSATRYAKHILLHAYVDTDRLGRSYRVEPVLITTYAPAVVGEAATQAMRAAGDLSTLTVPAQRSNELIDPVEGFAFSRPVPGAVWEMPPPDAAAAKANRRYPYGFLDVAPTLLKLMGNRDRYATLQLFCDIGAAYSTNSFQGKRPPDAYAFFQPNGALAAYVPMLMTYSADPSMTYTDRSPRASRIIHPPKDPTARPDGTLDLTTSMGVFVPTPVSTAERQTFLRSIRPGPDQMKPSEPKVESSGEP